MKRVVFHIDRVVLRGFRGEDPDGIVAGLRSELERQFADRGTGERLSSMANVPKLDGGRVNVRRGGEATQTGSAVGGAVARGIKR